MRPDWLVRTIHYIRGTSRARVLGRKYTERKSAVMRFPFSYSVVRQLHRLYAPHLLLSRKYFCSETFSKFKDTIYAVSSGRGKCGVAVIRVSGAMSQQIMLKMGAFSAPPQPRQALLRNVVCAQSKEKLDRGLVMWFPGPNSFTGEDCLELQVHGGVAVVTAILNSLNTFEKTRHAEAGEFTKRAFMNGKLTLTEVEGLADVIHSETEAQRRQAFRQMSGELNNTYSHWRKLIIKNTASVEAYIDFSEEENIEDDVIDGVRSSVGQLAEQLRQHLSDGRRGERLRDGVHVAILGRPNVGKSSLINYLTRRPVAIVSPVEGTTRDSIETTLNLDGYPVVLADTAGLRRTTDVVEQEGVRRAVNRSQEADVLIIMLSAQELPSLDGVHIVNKVAQLLTQHIKDGEDLKEKATLIVVNKVDLIDRRLATSANDRKDLSLNGPITSSAVTAKVTLAKEAIAPVVMTSLTEGQGLTELVCELTQLVKGLCGDPLTDSPTYTQARHRNHLTNCLDHLETSLQLLDHDVVITAENLRLACVEIGQITGQISTEDILDVVFKDFCIGK